VCGGDSRPCFEWRIAGIAAAPAAAAAFLEPTSSACFDVTAGTYRQTDRSTGRGGGEDLAGASFNRSLRGIGPNNLGWDPTTKWHDFDRWLTDIDNTAERK